MTVDVSPTLLLVPGAWHGAWSWARVQDELSRRRWASVAIDFPGPGRQDGPDDFAGHCAYLTQIIDSIDSEVIVVSHSMGGAVVSQAGASENVVGFVFVTAFALEPGESVAGVVDAQEVAAAKADDIATDGDYSTVDRGTVMDAFYHDLGEDLASSSFDRLTPEWSTNRSTPVTRSAWRSSPSYYVVCTEDRAITPELQRRFAARMNGAVEIATGHMPMLAKPVELADLIDATATRILSERYSSAAR